MTNTAGIASSGGLPQIVPGASLPVTAASTGIYGPPSGQVVSAAIVNNVSPWILTILTMGGFHTLWPYTYDLCYPLSTGFPFSFQVPPGGSAAAPAGALTALQVDWCIAGGSIPDGAYPGALTAQAVQAAISGTISVIVANTPTVDIAGTPTVDIGNTPNVAISGTPTVDIGSGSVAISGTPLVEVSSGTLDISGPVTVENVPATNLAVTNPQTLIATVPFGKIGRAHV